MATTPGSRRGETRGDITGGERDPLDPMQEPLGSMDRPTANTPAAPAEERTGRSFTATFAIAAVVLVAAFLIALYLGSNRSEVATTGSTQAPVADTTTGTTNNDTTGSTTAPSQQTAPAPGNMGSTTSGGNATTGTTGATTPPANP